MRKKSKGPGLVEKTIDKTYYLPGRRSGGIVKEEVWQCGEHVVKYSVAYIDLRIHALDNGRVLGYDNAHGHHHRHFMGTVQPFSFTGYDELWDIFQAELEDLWRDDENC